MYYPIVIHEQHREYVYPIERNKLAVRLKVKRDCIKSCTLIYFDSINASVRKRNYISMECYAKDNVFDYFEGIVKADTVICYLNYYFELFDGNEAFWLNYYGPCTSTPADDFFKYQYSNENEIFKAPDWVHESVFYQIFPERFCNEGQPGNQDLLEPWGSEPTRTNFMGGNLKGIIKRVEYLRDLGINAIYINPIFESSSNHKYDTNDYFSIDKHFGDTGDLKQLVAKCHENGIRVILDGVFNHCGYEFDKFQDVVKNGEASIYKDWFYIYGYPIDTKKLNYECFGYYYRMPKLRMSNPEVREYFFSVAKYWIETADIDGWRFDVADEVDYTFWQEMRSRLKAIRPDCFMMAETWKENCDMLKGDQFDSVMNYLFRDAVVGFFGKANISSFEFDARINKIIGTYSKQAVKSLFNLIGSHDTERFLNICNGDIRKMNAAIAFQMCFTGVPSMYYGDEIGITGENDPGCRKCMEWDENKHNLDIYSFCKKMIKIRKEHKVLVNGDFMSIYHNSHNNVYGFARYNKDERAYIVINNSEMHEKIKLPVLEESNMPVKLKDIMNSREYCIKQWMNNDIFFKKIVNGYNDFIEIELEPFQICVINSI